MENVLEKILKDSPVSKYPQLRQACQEAIDNTCMLLPFAAFTNFLALLINQQELMRTAPFELREKCLLPLQMALESKNSKLMSHAINGFQEIVRDKSFQSTFETDNEEKWLPSQLVQALSSVCSLPDDIQVDALKVLLQLAYTSGWQLSTSGILRLLKLFVDIYSPAVNTADRVRTAVKTTASQTMQAFCSFLQEIDGINLGSTTDDSEEGYECTDILEDILPVLAFLCDKLKGYKSMHNRPEITLLLQCVLSILGSLYCEVYFNKKFMDFLWQQLCPVLVAMLGSPQTDKNIITSQKAGDGKEIGRGSGCLATAPSCLSTNAKTIYSISAELVRLVGSVSSFRPVLASLFHRMLLYMPVQHRIEALRSLREILRQPYLMVKFAGPPLHDINKKPSRSTDLDLLKIAADSLHQCCNESSVSHMAISCILTLLTSLEIIVQGGGISNDYVEHINDNYTNIDDFAKSRDEIKNLDMTSEEYYINMEADEHDNHDQIYEQSDQLNSANNNEITVIVPDNVTENADATNQENDNDSYSDAVSDSLEKELTEIEGKLLDNEKNIIENVDLHVEMSYGETEDKKQDNEDDLHKEEENVHTQERSEELVDGENKEAVLNNCDETDYRSDGDCSSGTTEGPEDDRLEEDWEEEEELRDQEVAARLEKVPRTLLGKEFDGRAERERVERLCEIYDDFAKRERSNAKHFVEELKRILSSLLAIRSSIEADQAIQEFASNYCEETWKNQSASENGNGSTHIIIVNADGIYLATYSALLLNLKLIHIGYYQGRNTLLPLTEQRFVEEVHGSGVLVYLSATWLSELYQEVVSRDILGEAGYEPATIKNSALINLLTDMDGLGSTQHGAQQLSDYRRLERAVSISNSSPAVEAGMKFARYILTTCWDTVLKVLSVKLNCSSTTTADNLCTLLGTEGSKEEQRRAREATAESLDALQKAAMLSNILGLQSFCGAVFAQLAVASCPISPEILSSKRLHRRRVRKSVLASWNKPLRLHTSHILSLDVILSRGLELGSHSPECWKYVFRCSLYVMDLEHTYFSSNSRSSNPSRSTQQQKLGMLGKQDSKESTLFLPPVTSEQIDDEMVEPVSMPGSSPQSETSITDLVKKSAPLGSVLKDKQLQPVIEGLSQLVDRVFEDASSRLNLRALISFLAELCASSQEQLFSQSPCHLAGNALLMHRLADVVLRCARGGRPLVHVMKAWSVAAPHFVEAACHKEQAISKKAVAFIHDIVGTLLSSHPELPHFHFNESLFKPFENLLCLELCDADVQEQIISCICEFVEGCTTDVRSGWRPLFGALRAVHFSECEGKEQKRYLRVILDVFNAFLGTENILVFANAAVDCLLCLLKHVKGSDLQDSEDQSVADLELQPQLDLSMASLKYLERCANILTMMYQMPACPVFHSAHRIQVHKEATLVDSELPELEMVYFEMESDELSSAYQKNVSKVQPLSSSATLESLDSPTGVLHVWFLLLEGLAGAVTTCPKKYQPQIMETLFNMLNALKSTPGSEFGVYCINHLLLPLLQSWLRRTSRVYRGWNNFATNFKQCCGLTSDLVVDYLVFLAEKGQISETEGVALMVHQLFLVLTECITQSTESISRLGCACIRHLFMASAHIFSPELWEIASGCLQRACHVSLHSIHQLMACFRNDSDNFYGDIGQVKVAVRRDCLPQESLRLSQLAQQVFLLDCQSSNSWLNARASGNDDKSFVFLLHPPGVESSQNQDQSIVRIPFRNLVVGLVSHQVLLQTLVTVLLQGTQYMLPSLATLMTHVAPPSSPLQPIARDLETPSPLPGFLSRIPSKCLRSLLLSLTESYYTAVQFDSKPGLKFLIQKVAESNAAANLYKQAGISWTIHILVLFELCLHTKQTLTLDAILEEIDDFEKDKDHSNEDSGSEKWSPFVKLKDEFQKLCDSYVDMVLDKEGSFSAVDRISEEPIFLLTVPQDDISAEIRLFKKLDMGTIAEETAENRRSSVGSSDSEGSITASTAEAQDDKVYQVTTEKTIASMVNDYKRRKMQHSLPSTWRERRRKRSSSDSSKSQDGSETLLPEDVEKQRKSSILKDAEARIQVCTQLLQSVLDLHLSLADEQFRPLLPLIFPGIQMLVVYASDTGLRTIVADWLNRVGHCFGFVKGVKPLTPET